MMAGHRNDARRSKHLTHEELLAFAESSLAETAEKQRAALDGGAQLPFGFGSQPGDTLDLSYKGVQALPAELIDLIKDRVERYAISQTAMPPATIIYIFTDSHLATTA